MLHIAVSNANASSEFEHGEGPLEFGRGPQRDLPRCVIVDPYVSRDHLRIEQLAENRLQIENLSEHIPVEVGDSDQLMMHAQRVLTLPVRLRIGQTDLRISGESTGAGPLPSDSVGAQSLQELGESPDPQTLARWFETVICVQHAAATSAEFYNETAKAVVKLVGLDRGLVLLRQNADWMVAAHCTTNHREEAEFSRGVLDEMFSTRKTTYFEALGSASLRDSLVNIEAVVAAPIFDQERNVVGAVYGSRSRGGDVQKIRIRALEAQVVQVLAAAVGAGMERERQRADAIRSQSQFEQFFSPQLARELARDSNLLEGRQREVTILFSDVRDFSRISEQLGPRETFRMMQDVMDLQSTHIRAFDGVVVDYVGDGLLAMWNAPTDQPDHAARACRAVLAIMRQLPELEEKWNRALNRPLQLGVGVNTGVALVGNTGSRVKFKYGPMGPAVNLASRVEDATKQLGVPILITETTHRQLDSSFATRRLCQASLPGIGAPVQLFELSTQECTPQWQQRRLAFEEALAHFEARRWAEACAACRPLISDAEGNFDVASLQLLSRAVACLKSRPDPFDPIVHIRSK